MLARNDLEAYVSRNYGRCSRGPDCYHGYDTMGRPNGCLKTGWRGSDCPHWHPIVGPEREAILAAFSLPASPSPGLENLQPDKRKAHPHE